MSRIAALLALGLLLVALIVVVRASAETPRETRLEVENRRLKNQLSDYGRWVRTLQGVIRRPNVRRSHWLERAFDCLHRYEGPWTDPNPPYYGGLQMDLSFQRAYGREYLRLGTADQWPASVQIAVGIAGYLERGFQPWPRTRRACGL